MILMSKFENDSELIPADNLIVEALPEEMVADILLAQEDKLVIADKRFGSTDLWKIQLSKRYANVYPRRV
jgi:hypothetical protein